MSFLSAVGHFFSGASKVTTAIDPYLNLAAQLPIPGQFGTIVNSIIHVEQLVGDLGGKGTDKKAAVTRLVMLVYPDIDQQALSGAIDGIVKILNDLAAIQAAKAAKVNPPAPGTVSSPAPGK